MLHHELLRRLCLARDWLRDGEEPRMSVNQVARRAGIAPHHFIRLFGAVFGDFVSIVPDGVDGPAQADGSLPDIAFMRPKPGSRLIDAGINVELPFKGSAPNLGAFETTK